MKKQLHIYVQDTRQGDGEKQVETEPQWFMCWNCKYADLPMTMQI